MHRIVLRLAAAISLAALCLLPAGAMAAGGDEYALCIHFCSDVRGECEARCDTDCALAFPSNDPARRDCLSSCHEVCVLEDRMCNNLCTKEPIP